MAEPTHREILDTLHDLRGVIDKLADEVKETRDVVKAWGVVKGGGQAVVALGKFMAGIGVIIVGLKMAVVWFVTGAH